MVIDVPGEVLVQRLLEMNKMWQRYIKLFNEALEKKEKEETITDEDEKEFINLQLEIVRKAQFLEIATPERIFDLWKDMKKLLTQTPSLEILVREVPIRISSFRNIWHEVSISLNQKTGQLRHYLEQKETGKGKKK